VTTLVVGACGSATERRAEQAVMLRNTCVSLIERAFRANWPLIAAAAAADPALFHVAATGPGDGRPVDVLLTRCLP
jgi:hypothetical protein